MTLSDNDIDLRPYILSIFRQWRQIGLLAFLSAVAALAFSFLQPRTYDATATVLLTRSRATLSLADQFRTVSEPIDSRSRMEAMVSIGQSDALALNVLDLLLERLSPDEREFEEFKKIVEFSSQGDVIAITATAKDPDLAAEVANTWAIEAVKAINQAYSEEQPLAEIQNQLTSAESEYQSAQLALEEFIATNQINLLEKQISEAETLFTQIAEDRAWQISYYSDRKRTLEDFSVQAEALKRQLQSGNRSQTGNLGDSFALLLARTHAFGINSDTMRSNNLGSDILLNMQIDEPNNLLDSTTNYIADLENLIQTANEEMMIAEEKLVNLAGGVIQGTGYENIAATAAQIQHLKTQLESKEAIERELTSQRDLAWQAYQALAQKETEIKNVAQASNQVNLASPAIPPQKPAARGTIRNTAIAGVLGLLLGISWVLASVWWRSSDLDSKTNP